MNTHKPSDPFWIVAGFCSIGICLGFPVVWCLAPAADAPWLCLFMLMGYAGLLRVASAFR